MRNVNRIQCPEGKSTTNHNSVKSILRGAIVLAIFSLFLFSHMYPQSSEMYLSNGKHVRLDHANGGFHSVLTKNGVVQSVQTYNPDELVRMIVTFNDPPLSLYIGKKSALQKISIASVYTSMQESHVSFRSSLNTISQQLTTQLKSDYSCTITREYYRALNGVALQCKRGMIEKIRALPMVKYVSMDREVKANLKESVHQIRADIVQDSLGYTGKGVLVGDVDTGIDYMNPALGGGFGPAFRVIGGYDFANDDNDPMDDHGHGTHVAGIIGANGGDTLRGVAPGVKFLAVKVLSADGSGTISGVIAGIEYCLDPDGNPATDDAVDIISMSLGGSPSTDSPLDSAINNATKAGVLSVIAAGNSGQAGYGTIESPGTSESALTVGACDSINSIAYFSSLGPDPIHSFIKPEVVAPGVHILSTILNNQTASWSGTSMATPHVTGVAALLKQEHPSWTPEEIKAAIVNTAHSVGDTISVFAQGKGCIDALDAATARFVVEPGIMSFGYVDLAPPVWKDTITLTVKNHRSISQQTQISIIDGLPTGAALTFDRTSFSLAAGGETTILAVLSVPSSVSVLSKEPFAYVGKIKVTSDSDNVIVPFSFIKSATLVIAFDVPPVILNLIDRKNGTMKIVSFGENRSKYIIPITEGFSLDMLAQMIIDSLGIYNMYYIHHLIDNPTGLTYVFVTHDEATINMADDTLYDIHNVRVPLNASTEVVLGFQVVVYNEPGTYQSSFESTGYFPPDKCRYFFTPLDSIFLIKKVLFVPGDLDNYILNKSRFSLTNRQDIAIASGSNNLFGCNVASSYNDLHLPNPLHWRKSTAVNINTMRVYNNSHGYEVEGERFDFITQAGNFYINKPDIHDAENDDYFHSSVDIGASYDHSINDSNLFTDPSILRTPEFTIDKKGEAVFEQMRVTPLPKGSAMAAKLSTAYTYETVKSGDTIKIEQNAHVRFPDHQTYIYGGSLYMNWNNDWSSWEQSDFYLINNGGIKQATGISECRDNFNSYWCVPNFTPQVFAQNRTQTNSLIFRPLKSPALSSLYTNPYYEFDNMSPGTLRVLSDAHPYTLLGQNGKCTADFEYLIPSNTYDSTYFPSFNLLQVSVNGRAVDAVRPDQNGIIRLALYDPYNSAASVKLSLLLATGDEIVIPVASLGRNEYVASIPTYIPVGFIDIVASVIDVKGNKCELTASPGFYFGNTTANIHFDSRVRMTSYSLDNVDTVRFSTGDTLKYTLTLSNYGNGTARNVMVALPTTPYFKPVGSQSLTVDSIDTTDPVQIPINLIFQGKQQSSDELAYYSPSITWTSDGTTYIRNQKILVDIQNTITAVTKAEITIPNKFELYQNYPNPFNPATTFSFGIPSRSFVLLKIYDLLGREVATIVSEEMPAGSYTRQWNAAKMSSGIYFYRLQAGSFTQTKKLILLK